MEIVEELFSDVACACGSEDTEEEIEQVPMYMLVRRRLKDRLNPKEEIDQLDEELVVKRERRRNNFNRNKQSCVSEQMVVRRVTETFLKEKMK